MQNGKVLRRTKDNDAIQPPLRFSTYEHAKRIADAVNGTAERIAVQTVY
jgi:hypothetical protein